MEITKEDLIDIKKEVREKIKEIDDILTKKIEDEIYNFEKSDYVDALNIIAYQELRHMLNPDRSLIMEDVPQIKNILIKLLNMEKEAIEEELDNVYDSLDYIMANEYEFIVDTLIDCFSIDDTICKNKN